jgi:hypothetical protein
MYIHTNEYFLNHDAKKKKILNDKQQRQYLTVPRNPLSSIALSGDNVNPPANTTVRPDYKINKKNTIEIFISLSYIHIYFS